MYVICLIAFFTVLFLFQLYKKNVLTAKHLLLTTTKLTKDIAFKEIFHNHIMPPMLMTINRTINEITVAAIKSNPININETAKIVVNEIVNENTVSRQIVKYCS